MRAGWKRSLSIVVRIAIAAFLIPSAAVPWASAAGPPAGGSAAVQRAPIEWTRNSSLVKEEGMWEGRARLWDWTGGEDAEAPWPNRVDWVSDGRVEFYARDTVGDRYGAVAHLGQVGSPLDMATVETLVYEVTISGYSSSFTLAGWTGITAPAHLRLKDRPAYGQTPTGAYSDDHDDLYLEIYLFGNGLNHPCCWAFMDPFGDGNRAIKAVGFFPGIYSDHFMVRAPALPGYCSVFSNPDGTTTFLIDVKSLAAEAVARYNRFPYRRGYDLDDFEFYQAGTFAEAGYYGLAGLARLFGVPRAGYTLHGFRVTYTEPAERGAHD